MRGFEGTAIICFESEKDGHERAFATAAKWEEGLKLTDHGGKGDLGDALVSWLTRDRYEDLLREMDQMPKPKKHWAHRLRQVYEKKIAFTKLSDERSRQAARREKEKRELEAAKEKEAKTTAELALEIERRQEAERDVASSRALLDEKRKELTEQQRRAQDAEGKARAQLEQLLEREVKCPLPRDLRLWPRNAHVTAAWPPAVTHGGGDAVDGVDGVGDVPDTDDGTASANDAGTRGNGKGADDTAAATRSRALSAAAEEPAGGKE